MSRVVLNDGKAYDTCDVDPEVLVRNILADMIALLKGKYSIDYFNYVAMHYT